MSGEKKKISPSLIIAVIVIIILLAALVYYATLPPKVEVVPTTIVQTALKTETLPGTTIVRTEERTIVQTVTPTPTKPKVTLRFWCDKIGWVPKYKELFKEFEQKTGIKVEVTGYYDIDAYIATIKTLGGGPEAPDVFTWWTGKTLEELIGMGILMDVSPAWDANPGYMKSLRDMVTYNGKTYAVVNCPNNWVVVYDKSCFEKIGAKPPKTWDEFLKICEDLKKAGIIPFANGWASWQGFIFPTEILVRMYPDYYEDLNAGKASYTDPRMKEALQLMADMGKKGYFGDIDYVLSLASPTEVPTSIKMLAEDKAAMIYYGDWIASFLKAEGYTDWGMFILPNINPKLEKQSLIIELGPIVANKGTPHPEETMEFLKWWMSPETIEKWCKAMDFVPWNEKVSTAFLPEPIQNILKIVAETKPRAILRYWEAAPTKEFNVRDKFISAAQEILKHPEKIDSLMAEVEELNKAYWAKYGKG